MLISKSAEFLPISAQKARFFSVFAKKDKIIMVLVRLPR